MKLIIKLLFLLIVLLVVGVIFGFVSIDKLAARAIEKAATFALGVETKVDAADVGVMSGEFGMRGLNVANPEGYDTPHFLDLGEGGVAVSFGTLREETVELPHLTLRELDVHLQKTGDKANYQVVLDNLKRFERRKDGDTAEGRRYIVREILIEDVTVHVDLLPAGGRLTRLDVPIEEIRLTDVGSGTTKGMLLGELAGTIVKAILQAVVDKGGGLIPDDLLGNLRGELGQLESLRDMGIGLAADLDDSLRGIGDQAKDLLEDAAKVEDLGKSVEDAKKGLEDAAKGIGDLLGGNKKDE